VKLTKRLRIGGIDYPLVEDVATLSLSRPGRAVFSVMSNAPLSGVVEYSLGYNPQKLHRFFIGYVENSMPVNVNTQRVVCRELTAVLDRLMPLNLRHVTFTQVLNVLSDKTALSFVIPDAAYTHAAPYFYSWGGGYHVLDALGRAFEVDQFMWQLQGDGKVFAGPWSASYWSGKPVELSPKNMTDHGFVNQAKVPVMPLLKPGAHITQRGSNLIVTQVQLAGSYMNITWSENPWSQVRD